MLLPHGTLHKVVKNLCHTWISLGRFVSPLRLFVLGSVLCRQELDVPSYPCGFAIVAWSETGFHGITHSAKLALHKLQRGATRDEPEKLTALQQAQRSRRLSVSSTPLGQHHASLLQVSGASGNYCTTWLKSSSAGMRELKRTMAMISSVRGPQPCWGKCFCGVRPLWNLQTRSEARHHVWLQNRI